MSREDELKTILKDDRGNPAFAELADLLMAEGRSGEALTTLLSGLSSNPSHHVGRLILARLYVHLGFTPFAARELELLVQTLPQNQSLKKLLQRVSPGSAVLSNRESSDGLPGSGDATVAEGEFDIDVLGSLEDKKR